MYTALTYLSFHRNRQSSFKSLSLSEVMNLLFGCNVSCLRPALSYGHRFPPDPSPISWCWLLTLTAIRLDLMWNPVALSTDAYPLRAMTASPHPSQRMKRHKDTQTIQFHRRGADSVCESVCVICPCPCTCQHISQFQTELRQLGFHSNNFKKWKYREQSQTLSAGESQLGVMCLLWADSLTVYQDRTSGRHTLCYETGGTAFHSRLVEEHERLLQGEG